MTERSESDIQRIQQLRKELDLKIQEYQEAVNPGQMVLDWVLLTQRSSMELAAQSRKGFGIAVADGQSFIVTRGLLAVAIDIERADLLKSVIQQGR